jgi:FkbM family methyltransferase
MSFLSSGNHHLRQVVKMAINYQGKRDVTLRQEIFDLVRPLAPAPARESGGVWYYVSTKDYGLSRIVFATGSYEQDIMDHTIALAETHVGRSPLLDGRIFLDIGAENYKFLRCNLIANEVDDRVQTLQVALSEREGTGTLEVAEESWGDHRVRMKSGLPDGVYRESTRRVTPVRLMSFDDMAREISLDLSRVGIVWMDVQGHEGHVLAGAKSLLASETPLAIEYWPYGLRRADGLDMLHRLIADNYRTVVDVRASMEGSDTAELHATEVSTLAGRYGGETYTDLLILK